jgi:hypothetical protein
VRAHAASARDAAVAFGAFVAGYFASLATAALLFALFVAAWWASGRSAVGLGVAAVAAFGGPTVESLLVGRGAFVHHQVLFFGVPGWLPFLYLVAAVALTTLASWLVDGEF